MLARSTRASPASLRWRFPPLRAVQGCKCIAAAAAFVVGSDGPSPCSLDASVASFVTLAFPPLRAVQGCKCFAAAAAFVVGSDGPLPCSLARRERRQLRYAGVSTASRGAGLHVLYYSRCLCRLGSRPSPCSLARRERRQLRYAGVFHRFARFRAASALLQPLPSSSALMGRCRARSRRASPASLRWRFHRCARCRAACALLQPVSSSSALGRRRTRLTRASPASYTLVFLPLRAVQGCMCFAAAAAFVVGFRPSPCSLAWRERCQLCYTGVSTASRGARL